jgi:hypothetical protein
VSKIKICLMPLVQMAPSPAYAQHLGTPSRRYRGRVLNVRGWMGFIIMGLGWADAPEVRRPRKSFLAPWLAAPSQGSGFFRKLSWRGRGACYRRADARRHRWTNGERSSVDSDGCFTVEQIRNDKVLS